MVRLDPTSRTPLYRQIYDDLRAAIVAGRLARGVQLPAARTLAHELLVSRQTVSLALDQLRAEGYVETRERSGTFVSDALPDELLVTGHARITRPRLGVQGHAVRRPDGRAHRPIPGPTKRSSDILDHPSVTILPRPFRVGLPAIDVFPWNLWARLVGRRLRNAGRILADYGDPLGYPPLRTAIASYVSAARGVVCIPDQVVITNGAQQGLDLIARFLITPGDDVWMDEPGYPGARDAFAAAGAKLVPVPVDESGLSIVEGVRRAPQGRVVYVTPSHQYPLGVTMTAARRLELLRWARASGAWIIEDDYDSEFRYASRPLASLQGLDDSGRVVYVGTFSKTLFPGLRIGYLVLREALVDALAAARYRANRHGSSIEQATLTDFITNGHFTRHIRRMRLLYQERRDALLQEARTIVSPHLEIGPADAGMHVVGWLSGKRSDREVAARAAAVGLEVTPLSQYAMRKSTRGGLLLGFAAFPPRALRKAMVTLATIINE
jgi:GntR family transcriptional regulator/MocR family aminotransferase